MEITLETIIYLLKNYNIMTLLPFEKIKREVLVKVEEETNPNHGCRPEERNVEELIDYGVVNVNKPEGPTSHQVADYVQRILHIKKSGHGGSLDPGVTGVLPTALGRATRVVSALLKSGKEYVGIMHIHKPVEEVIVRKTINEFVGKITQLPPIKSSVKRQLREREIYYFEIIEINGQDVLFKLGCQAGTYVRKLCHDIGVKLNIGAHMAELVRTKAGPFKLENSVTLQDLEDAYWYWKNEKNEKLIKHCIKPIEFAVEHLPKIWIRDSAVNSICHGANLNIPGIAKLETEINEEDIVAIMTLKNELVAIGTAKIKSNEVIKQEKGFVVKPTQVFMQVDKYLTKK